MIALEIRYRSFFMPVKIKGSVPESWDEINGKQLLEICRVDHDYKREATGLITAFTGFKKSVVLKLKPFMHYRLGRLLDFMGEKEACTSKFCIKRVKGTQLIAPEDKLKGVSFGQFIFCESYYTQWIREKDQKSLEYLIASLYVRGGKRFNSDEIEKNCRIISKTDPSILRAIAFNYSMVIRWLKKRYPMIFSESESIDPIEKDEKMHTSIWVKF
ncbi:MAG: hypothetical protein WCJ95_20610, partial [Mariniphaga sp.]